MKFFARARQSAVVVRINGFVNSKYMIFVLAFLTLMTYLLNLEMYLYVLACLLGIYLCLFGKDMLCLAPIALFMYISPSYKSNPTLSPDSILLPKEGMWAIVAFIVVFLVLFFCRIGFSEGGFGNFFKVKRKLLVGFLVLFASFLLGGVGYENYTWYNLRYAIILFLALFLLYYILTATVEWKDVPKEYFAWLGLCVGLTVAGELINSYVVSFNDIFTESGFERGPIYTGWGIYNTMGAVLSMSLPCAFYLAATKKHGYLFNIIGHLLLLAIIFTASRGSIVMSLVLYVICVVATLWRKPNRKGNLIVFIVFWILAAVVIFFLFDVIVYFFTEATKSDSGRLKMYYLGIGQFVESPLFGEGFFNCDAYSWPNAGGITLVPYYWHNSIVEMLASCGLVGILAYYFHRYQTIRLITTNPSLPKTFAGLVVLSLLLTSLLDCHLFNIGCSLFYSVFLAFAEKSDEQISDSEDDLLVNWLHRRKEGKKPSSVHPASEE